MSDMANANNSNNMFIGAGGGSARNVPSAAASSGTIGSTIDWRDANNRATALAHAVALNAGSNCYTDADIMESAQQFLAFLNGPAAK